MVPAKVVCRETWGAFPGGGRPPFERVPARLRFTLRDMVPSSLLRDHVFMGFTQCGQFLLSFTCEASGAQRGADFREGYSFRLHFLAWRPGAEARPVHSVPIFDDERADNRVRVSVAQWKRDPRTLVVYGAADSPNERSYLSVVGVPRLGCRKCRALEAEEAGAGRCLEHNFAVHTKFYCGNESPAGEPVVQLAPDNRVLIYTDFIHALEIEIGSGFREASPERQMTAPRVDPCVERIFVESSASRGSLVSPPLRSPGRRPAESLSRFGDRLSAYEFVDDSEGECEKLSLFRKRRLADKKYEFREDNAENIVPFRVLRYRVAAASPLRAHNQINEDEYRVRAMQEDGSFRTVSLHDHSSKTLAECAPQPARDSSHLVHSGNTKCSKHFKRRFLESEDDVASTVTDSEDDCLSGYHVALPLIAHGARYAPLQPVSGAAPPDPRARAPVLQASQRSLDIELLCNEVCLRLCLLHKKKFVYCFDWGCHIVNVCQSSGCLCGVCAMWLWGSEEDDEDDDAPCLSTLDRKQYAAECLFVWDLSTGLYRTEHVSFAEDSTPDALRESGSQRARQMALKLAPIPSQSQDVRLLTMLTGGRSIKCLTDADHCIEIRKHLEGSETESSEDESDSD